MGKKHSYTSLAPKMNFFQRLVWQWKYNHSKQVMIVHKSGLNWQVFTRSNSKEEFKLRETLCNKKAKQAFQYVKVRYPDYLLYMPKAAMKKAALSQRVDAVKKGQIEMMR